MLKVTETHVVKDEWEYRESLSIQVELDGVRVGGASFYDGEPEDNNICRNFSDVHSIVRLMQLAWKAGAEGKDMVVEHLSEEEE